MTCPRSFKSFAVITAIVALLFSTLAGSIATKANEPYVQEYEVYDLVVKAGKVGLIGNYASLNDFNPSSEATPAFCKSLLKKAAKINGLKAKKISGSGASFAWLGNNATKLLKGTDRPEWQEDPELWAECLSNLEKEVQGLYGRYNDGSKISRIEALAFVVDIFFTDIPVGWDISDEALLAYNP